jgi:uncharacterized protein (TIGR02246 family)
MSDHELKRIIEAADRAITAEDFDALMDFYSEDATLVVRPGQNASGKAQIRKAFAAIADHFNHKITVTQGNMKVIEGDDTALVVMETVLNTAGADGTGTSGTRRATYVFRKSAADTWLCVIDNSYGTDLLDAE